MRPRLSHVLNALIFPAPDLPGQWVAHCLELDIVSQGNSALDALEMIADAIESTARVNLERGLPPFTFRSAPPDAWQRLRDAHDLDVQRILRIESEPQDEVTIRPLVADAG